MPISALFSGLERVGLAGSGWCGVAGFRGRLILLGCAVLMFVAVAAQLLTGAGTATVQRVFDDWLYDGVGFLAAGACFFGRRRTDATAWRLIGLGILTWTLG